MHISSDHARPSGVLSAFENSGIPFVLEMTGGSMTVKMDNIQDTIISKGSLSAKELNFVKRVKDFAKKSGKDQQPYDQKNVRYFGFLKYQEGEYLDVAELDINSAYWKCALDLGYISTQIYAEGLDVSKTCRLIALGSLATRKRIFNYDPITKKYEQKDDVFDPVLRSYFFHIAYRVGSIVYRFAELYPHSTLFFWVDALFISSQMKEVCHAYFKEHGLQMKEKEIESIIISKGGAFDYDYKVKDAKGVRRFVMKRGKMEDTKARKAFAEDIEKIKTGRKISEKVLNLPHKKTKNKVSKQKISKKPK